MNIGTGTALQEQFASNLLELRKARSLTQGQLSKLSEIPRSTIANFESGSGNPSLLNLTKLAEAMGTKVEEFLSRPRSTARLIKNKNLKTKIKGGSVEVLNMLPAATEGLKLERLDFPPHSGFTGVPHLSGAKEYYLCFKGKTQVIISSETYHISPGDILIFDGHEKHSYKNPYAIKAVGFSIIVEA